MNAQRPADIGNMPVRALPARLRVLRGDHAAICGRDEGVRDKEWIAAELLHLIIRQVRCVADIHDMGDAGDHCFLVQEERSLHRLLPGPRSEFILAVPEFLIALDRDLDLSLLSVVNQPVPDLGYPVDGVVIPVGIDEDVGVEELEHGAYPVVEPRAENSRSGWTCLAFTPRIRAALTVGSAPARSIRPTRPVRARPMR